MARNLILRILHTKKRNKDVRNAIQWKVMEIAGVPRLRNTLSINRGKAKSRGDRYVPVRLESRHLTDSRFCPSRMRSRGIRVEIGCSGQEPCVQTILRSPPLSRNLYKWDTSGEKSEEGAWEGSANINPVDRPCVRHSWPTVRFFFPPLNRGQGTSSKLCIRIVTTMIR